LEQASDGAACRSCELVLRQPYPGCAHNLGVRFRVKNEDTGYPVPSDRS